MNQPGYSRLLAGVESLAELYAGLLVDQFGVLHDSRALFPGAREALIHLRLQGCPVVILSNSGKRSSANVARLASLGIEPELYTGLVTSGEAAFEGLAKPGDPTFDGLGRRCLFIARGDDRTAVAGLGFELVEEPEAAEFVLLAGLDPAPAARRRVAHRLARAQVLGLPLLCTNPDLVSLEGDSRVEGPGSFARRYAEAGGDVRMVGKPWPAIYQAALRLLDLPPGRLCAVGDSLHHDIAGAAVMGIDGALVTSVGVHAERLRAITGDAALIARVATLAHAPQTPLPRWLLRTFAPTGFAGQAA